VMGDKQYIENMIDRARKAQKEFETYSQEKVDEAVKAIGLAIYNKGEELARLAVDETGMGKYEDKIAKNKGKAKAVWYRIKDQKSRGVINFDEEKQIIEVSKPIGVLGCVTPSTNPTMTPS